MVLFVNTVAFNDRCIPPRRVDRRLHTLGMLASRALRCGASVISVRHRIYEQDHLEKALQDDESGDQKNRKGNSQDVKIFVDKTLDAGSENIDQPADKKEAGRA